jgi:hypothetical protein
LRLDVLRGSAAAIDLILNGHPPTSLETSAGLDTSVGLDPVTAPGATGSGGKVADRDPPRLTINRDGDNSTICLDGVTYAVSLQQAAYVENLASKPGLWVASREMQADDPALSMVSKMGRDVRDKLPEPIRRLIRSETGKGSLLTLD